MLIVALLISCGHPDTEAVTLSPSLALASVGFQNVVGNAALVGLADRALDGEALAATVQGRLALTLAAGCALADDQSVIAGGLEFLGETGIAPLWLRCPLDSRERALVTGCMLARLSVSGLAVPISLRGPTLAVPADEAAEWSLEEGAFGGDLFAPSQLAVACRGRGQREDPSAPAFGPRACATPIPGMSVTFCALRFLGDCEDVCDRHQGRYRYCRDGQETAQWNRTRLRDVVTTYLIP